MYYILFLLSLSLGKVGKVTFIVYLLKVMWNEKTHSDDYGIEVSPTSWTQTLSSPFFNHGKSNNFPYIPDSFAITSSF